MTTHELRSLLDDVPDTRELVLRGIRGACPVRSAWRDASDDAGAALQRWLSAPGDRMAYAAYRAAQDREDAAMDVVRQAHGAHATVS